MQDVEFKDFSRRPDAYQKVCGLIAPSIFGHDDVKKAVACLLFGGARKVRILSSPVCFTAPCLCWKRNMVGHDSLHMLDVKDPNCLSAPAFSY